ncbi:tail assembly chaperone [Rhodococcus phage Peregrin]|nr:tail assembly chaperone [Rhodococcus phage Peregrin]
MVAAKKNLKNDDDFTYAELVEYEDLAGEPLDALNDSDRPRLKKIAYLGWIRAKRTQKGISFQDYIENTDATRIMADAFGEQSEEKKRRDELLDARAQKKARFCLYTGVQPSEFENLTLREQSAFVEAAEEKYKPPKKGK